ncbi:MAG TPA: arylamine N-acetyltransferase [Roseiflexaceae bacterium]|nr:arylamine N-acetyltransferase [Roseiflexaceae bacterium]
MIDVDAYLMRLGDSGGRSPSPATLRRLHVAHQQAVPFENLDIHLNRPIALDEAALFDKIIRQRRGGFCYELNGLFGLLLRELGFQVTLLSAGVFSRGRFGPEFDHLALAVEIDGIRWLADVGFGESFREPLLLDSRDIQQEGHHRFQLVDQHPYTVLTIEGDDARWVAQYRISPTARQMSDYAGMCHYHQVSPASNFTRRRICSLTTAEGRVTLSERVLIISRNHEREEQRIEDDAAWLMALRNHFGIDLPAAAAGMPSTDPNIPLLEYDPDPQAVINPNHRHEPIDLPPHLVLCFFADVIERLVQERGATRIAELRSEIGSHPIYALEIEGRQVAVLHPGVGAPLGAALLETAIGRGATRIVACGGAGVLDPSITVGHVVVPALAVRDEGTSYHYLPAGREIGMQPDVMASLVETLEQRGIPYIVTKTWTTDGLFRETPAKIQRRRAEGCLVVEMEAAAFFAVAQHRGVRFGQLLYGADDISAPEWDHRGWMERHSVREALFDLAATACLAL